MQRVTQGIVQMEQLIWIQGHFSTQRSSAWSEETLSLTEEHLWFFKGVLKEASHDVPTFLKLQMFI